MRTKDFFCYNAGSLAIDPVRPWQVCQSAICGKFATQAEAEAEVQALQKAKDNGTLPCNLNQWVRPLTPEINE